MKNKFIWPACVLALGLSLAGCKDALDLEPQQSIDAATAYNTTQKISAAVVGAYARLDDPRLYGTDLILVPELYGEVGAGYTVWNGSFTNYNQIYRRTQISTLSNAQGIWTQAYNAINQCNLILANLSVVTDAGQRTQFEGEARFIRGLMYFELVRLYAQQYTPGGANTQPGVPINLTAITNTEQADTKLPRSTVQQVYSQVIADLQAAILDLPTQNITRASRYSAEAILARVYLQQGNYTAARAMADDVINNSGAGLQGSVGAVFANRNSGESLFEIQQNDQNNAGTSNDGLATYFAGYSPNGDQTILYGRGDVYVQPAFVNLYGADDVRGSDGQPALTSQRLIYVSDGNNKTGRYRTIKWRTYGQNIPVARLAEMYLIRAEADVRGGSGGGASATADINLLRARSGATTYTTVTLANVLLERQLELAFEGFRIHDLKRTGRNVGTLPATSSQLILPIPQREINNNPLLTQNAGYQ